MNKTEFLKNFSIVAVVFVAHYFSDILGVEGMVMTHGLAGWVILFGWYLAFMIFGNRLINKFIK